jgi:flagellar biosynthesis protein FlhG
MTQRPGDGEILFRKLERVTSRFLDVVLDYAGEIPEDSYVRNAIREQRTLMDAYPSSPAARGFKKLALTADRWPTATSPRGNLEFFVERLVGNAAPQLEAAR